MYLDNIKKNIHTEWAIKNLLTSTTIFKLTFQYNFADLEYPYVWSSKASGITSGDLYGTIWMQKTIKHIRLLDIFFNIVKV